MTIRRWAISLVGVVVACGASPVARAPQPSLPPAAIGKIWMHVDGDWVRPPAGTGYPADYASAPATLLRFKDDRELSMVQCWVIRSNGLFSISAGDPHRVFIGTWAATATGADITYRLVDESVQRAGGGKVPGPEQKGRVSVVGGALRFGGASYAPSNITVDRYEELVAPERAKLAHE